ncbi:MAG: carboxypeptidase regulatory-like domain-containing protein [Lysobacterales bacterium]
MIYYVIPNSDQRELQMKIWKQANSGALLLLLSGVLGLASGSQLQAAVPEGLGIGGITGMVVDSSRLVGIPGASVSIYDQQGNELTITNAGVDGRYEIAGLPVGSYFLLAGGEGFRPEVYDDLPCEPAPLPPCQPTAGMAVVVADGVTTDGIDFDLVPRVRNILGRVTDAATGQPLSGALIQFWTLQGNPGGLSNTNEHGNYAIWVPAVGNYFINVQAVNHIAEAFDDHPCIPICNVTAGNAVTVADGLGTSGIDFALDHVGAIAGTITDSVTGHPVLAAQVDLLDLNGTVLRTANTGLDGRYVLNSAGPGSYLIRASKTGFAARLYPNVLCPEPVPGACDPSQGTPLDVAVAGIVDGIDLSIEFVAFGFEGHVRSAATGLPLASILVEARSSDNQRVWTARTDAYGDYRITATGNLGSGPYFVYTDAGPDWINEKYNNVACPWSSSPLIGTCRDVVGDAVQPGIQGPPARQIDFDLEPSHRLFVNGFEN